MKKRTYYYKRTLKRIIKLVKQYIDHYDGPKCRPHIWVNIRSWEVMMDEWGQDEDWFGYPAIFFVKFDKSYNDVPDERKIEHWVLTDLKRYFFAHVTPVQVPLSSL